MLHILLAILVLQSGLAEPRPAGDLPEHDEFLRNVRSQLRSDRLLQSQYTFNLKVTESRLDKKGNVEKTEVNEYEVYPSLEEDLTYTKHVSKNGIRLKSGEIEKQDRKHNKKLAKRQKMLSKEDSDDRTRRLAREAEEKRREEEIIDEVFQLYDISMAGRERIEGHSAIRLDFRPRPEYKPSSREAKILSKFAGRAWFCEEDFQLIRIETGLIENLSFLKGILARIHKGTEFTFQRRRINDEIWLPAEQHISGTARVLLFKKIRFKYVYEYSDYKKFTVGTEIKYLSDKQP